MEVVVEVEAVVEVVDIGVGTIGPPPSSSGVGGVACRRSLKIFSDSIVIGFEKWDNMRKLSRGQFLPWLPQRTMASHQVLPWTALVQTLPPHTPPVVVFVKVAKYQISTQTPYLKLVFRVSHILALFTYFGKL